MIFSEAVMTALFPDNFKMPNIASYDDKGDPATHVEVFCSWLDFERVSELAKCQAFPLTLLGLAQSWHSRLPSRSITYFYQQVQLFNTHFLSTKQLKKLANHLMTLI